MAGYGGESSTCNSVLPSGNIVNALKHWQYRYTLIVSSSWMVVNMVMITLEAGSKLLALTFEPYV